MYRKKVEELKSWKDSKTRKPLILNGARQVGKTWLLQHFGKESYKNIAYLNLDRDEEAREIFSLNYDTKRIISRVAIHTGEEIIPGETLIIIDEIQESPAALGSLKYFCEEAPEYHIAVAGSLLGVKLMEEKSFPVGKVDFLNLNPLTFEEFLIAINEKKLADALSKKDFSLVSPFHEKLNDLLKTYLVVGGMPEAVVQYLNTNSLLETRKTQDNIISAYERDFSKHANKFDVPRINEIFNIIPHFLAKENKKFMFGAIKKSARAREYESALLWLEGAGIATRVPRVNSLSLPLSAYADRNIFKLFLLDVGLLGAKAELRPDIIFSNDSEYREFKGAVAEQFIFQEFIARQVTPYYYSTDDSRIELDFLIDTKTNVTPVEVKSGQSLASKSLKLLLEKNPTIKRAFKFSLLPLSENEKVINLPLYLAGFYD